VLEVETNKYEGTHHCSTLFNPVIRLLATGITNAYFSPFNSPAVTILQGLWSFTNRVPGVCFCDPDVAF